MTILFAGTPEIAVDCLSALVEAGHRVEVLTNPDAPAGRGGRLAPPPVKGRAEALGLPVHQPLKLDAEARAAFEGRFDLLVSFAYGKIFGPKFLALFSRGGLNVHPSLLPRWRGPAPLSAAVAARDTETGISVQTLALGMDEGDLVIQGRRPLDGTETTGSLTEWAARTAPALLTEAVARIADGTARPEPQKGEPVYCRLGTKDDGRLVWSRSAADLDAQARACDPWPGTFTVWNGERLAVRQTSVRPAAPSSLPPGTVLSVDKSDGVLVQTGDGVLAVREWQLPARKSLDFRSFLNGNPGLIGSRLGEPV